MWNSDILQTACRAGRLASAIAGFCWLAACDPADLAGSAADSETPDPNQFAEAELSSVSSSGVGGVVRFNQNDEFLEIKGRITGLSAGAYGLHVHQARDCASVNSNSAGPIFSPDHDSPALALDPDLPNEVGNLGDIVADDTGVALFELVDTQLTLAHGEQSILDHALVVHEALNGTGPEDLPVLAGKSVGCGVITRVHAPTYVP